MNIEKAKNCLRVLAATPQIITAMIARENRMFDDIPAAESRPGLAGLLKSQNKTRWLEIGSGQRPEKGFISIDIYPADEVEDAGSYFQCNIIHPEPGQLEALGTFDLIRLQHAFEHFSPEDGVAVLRNCYRLLVNGGYLLITVPDLRKFAEAYCHNRVSAINEKFQTWSLKRIDSKSPESFYFSIFTHSLQSQPHLWCYDYEGLEYQVKKTGLYTNIRELRLSDPLASIPFTHNRPKEDVCILAQRSE